ncbi:MAG: hypothetical protein ACLPKB_08260 [Xanthobacteraceae bacterium]
MQVAKDPDAVIACAGFIRARYAGSGFPLIRREAFPRMCAHYRQLQFQHGHSLEAEPASTTRQRRMISDALTAQPSRH